MDTYKNIRFINKGSYSKVYSATDKNGNPVAIKKIVLSKSNGIPSTSLREIFILRQFKNKNIIGLKNVLMSDEDLYLVFEYCKFDLMIYISHFPHSILDLYKQILQAVSFIHRSKIIHRDLKPQNILVDSKATVKLADFGLAFSIDYTDNNLSHDVVTLNYRAPELLRGLLHYSYFIDMWSIGCIFYEMVVGEILFNSYNERQLEELIGAKSINDIREKLKMRKLNSKIIQGILECLNIDFNERISAEKMLILFN